jgi:hypothetical protein
MPNTNIQRGPATGGPPANFTNLPEATGVYVDGLTNQLMVGTGSSGATAGALVRQGTPLVGTPFVFSALPAGVEGMLAVVSDSSVNTWGTAIAGGGANRVLAYYNGTAWTVAAK